MASRLQSAWAFSRRRPWLVGAGLLVAVIAVAFAFGFRLGPKALSCARDDQIATNERRAIEAEAIRFVSLLQKGDGAGAYEQLSAGARKSGSRDQILTAIAEARPAGPAGKPVIKATWRIKGVTSSDSDVICVDANGEVVSARFSSSGREAHVLATERSGDVEWTYALYLRFERGAWKVHGFTVPPTGFGSHTGLSLWASAKEQRARGNDLNAYFLYRAVGEMLDLGGNIRSAESTAFEKDRDSFQPPPEVQGGPPVVWTLNGQAFEILRAGMTGMEGSRAIVIYQRAPPGETNVQLEARNRRFIEAYRKAHPEWEEAFDTLAVRAFTSDTYSYGSLYRKGIGYWSKVKN